MSNNRIQNLVDMSSDLVEASKAIFDNLEKTFQKRLKEIEHDLVVRFEKKLEQQQTKHLSEMDDLRNYCTQLRSLHDASFGEFKELLKALPTPQVHLTVPTEAILVKALPANVSVSIPENAIQIQQIPSQVHVSVPESAIEIKQLPSNVNVTLPEKSITVQPAQVTLPKDSIKVEVKQLPADKAIKLELAQPKRVKKVEKSIIYSPNGRPDRIIEEIKEE